MGNKDDITLDFSWVSNIFSGNSKKSNNKKQVKNNKLFEISTIIILLLIPLILSVYIRSLPNQLQIADEWGKSSIYNYIRNDVVVQVSAQYPNLPVENREALINEEFNRQIAQNQAQVDQLALQQAEGLRVRFRDDSGETYLGDIDSYYWLRYTRNIIEKGDYADERRDGVAYDNHMSAPDGVEIIPNLYPYIEAWIYKIVKMFNSGFSLMNAAYYTPMFLSFIAIIAAFFIGKKISGNLAGFVAAMLIAVNATILSRSLGSDNDIINAVFPLLIMLFVFYAFDSKNYKETIIYAAITGLLTGIYSFAWSGWWFMFLFIIGAGIAYIAYNVGRDVLKNKSVFDNKKIKTVALLIGIYLFASFISLSMFGNQTLFLKAFKNPLKIVTIQSASKGIYLWPNVYTTVAELNSADMNQIIANLGGKMFLVLALLGTIFSLVKFKPENKLINAAYLVGSAIYFMVFVDLARANTINLIFLLFLISIPMFVGLLLSIIYNYELDPIHSLIMTIWFMATIYASTKGIRFILLIVPAFVISFSFIIGEFVKNFSEWFGKSLDMHKAIPQVLGVLLALIILIQPIRGGIETGYRYVPSINDAWVNSLTKINQEAAPDAIINSWWDFGHWFKYWADRRVTFDGASQNSQQAHWIGKVLLTNDEDQSRAILRMLDCGGTSAETQVNMILGGDTQKSVEYTYKLLSMDETSAETELLKITDQETTNKILEQMYCEPPENYFITSGDMVGKSGVWAHFGSWNFERAKIYLYYTSKTYDEFVSSLSTELGFTAEEAQRTYYELSALSTDRAINDWIAPWPSYGGQASCSRNTNETLLCTLPPNIPLLVNTTSNEAYTMANGQYYYPNNFAYVKDEKFKIKDYSENEIGYGIALLPNNNVIFMTPELTGSLFTRLFYYDSIGLKHFEKFSDQTDVTGLRVITWTVNWDN